MPLYELHDFTKFKIERNVEIPERESNASRMRQLIEDMEYGDSVELPPELINVARAATGHYSDRFVIRDVKDSRGTVVSFRLWKLETKDPLKVFKEVRDDWDAKVI